MGRKNEPGGEVLQAIVLVVQLEEVEGHLTEIGISLALLLSSLITPSLLPLDLVWRTCSKATVVLLTFFWPGRSKWAIQGDLDLT